MRKTYDKPEIYLDGDSLIQLEDGRILSFYFRDFRPLKIYTQNDFKEILSINVEDILKQNEKVNDLSYDDEDETFELAIIQLKNKSILVGYYKYLIEIKLNEINFKSKIVFEDKEIILNINELPDGRIILITNSSILVLNNFILKDKYNININWKILPVSSTESYCSDFNQYFSSTMLPDERILLRSFSTELNFHPSSLTYPPKEFTHSKIIFLNTQNFEQIKITEEFKSDCRALVFEKLIIIQDYHDIYLYNIKSLKNIKKMKIEEKYSYFEKYNENLIIAYSVNERINDLLIFRVEGSDIIKSCEIKRKFNFREEIEWNFYSSIKYNNKILFVLKDKRIVLLCHGAIILLDLELE